MINNITLTLQNPKMLNKVDKFDFISGYYVGCSKYTLRNTYNFTLEDIKTIKETTNKKLFVTVNKLIHEDELEDLTNYLKSLNDIGIDYVVFGDFAIYEICQENNLDLNLIYSTETTITNSNFTTLAKEFSFSGVELAKEITLEEVKQICEKKESLVSINIHGHQYMYQSVRKLLTNYDHVVKEDIKMKNYYLFDEERNKYYPIVENEQGTHILASNDVTMIHHLNKIIDINADYLKIDTFGYKDEDVLTLLNIYEKALHYLTENRYEENKRILFEELKNAFNYKTFDTGFYFKKTVY